MLLLNNYVSSISVCILLLKSKWEPRCKIFSSLNWKHWNVSHRPCSYGSVMYMKWFIKHKVTTWSALASAPDGVFGRRRFLIRSPSLRHSRISTLFAIQISIQNTQSLNWKLLLYRPWLSGLVLKNPSSTQHFQDFSIRFSRFFQDYGSQNLTGLMVSSRRHYSTLFCFISFGGILYIMYIMTRFELVCLGTLTQFLHH